MAIGIAVQVFLVSCNGHCIGICGDERRVARLSLKLLGIQCGPVAHAVRYTAMGRPDGLEAEPGLSPQLQQNPSCGVLRQRAVTSGA